MVFKNSKGEDFVLPGKAIGAGTLLVTVFLAGSKAGDYLRDIRDSQRASDVRLCRIERALNLPLWPTCPDPQQQHASQTRAVVQP